MCKVKVSTMSELKYTEKRARISKQISLKNINCRNKNDSIDSAIPQNNLKETFHNFKVKD